MFLRALRYVLGGGDLLNNKELEEARFIIITDMLDNDPNLRKRVKEWLEDF